VGQLEKGKGEGIEREMEGKKGGCLHNTHMCGRQARQQPKDVFRVVMVKSGNG